MTDTTVPTAAVEADDHLDLVLTTVTGFTSADVFLQFEGHDRQDVPVIGINASALDLGATEWKEVSIHLPQATLHAFVAALLQADGELRSKQAASAEDAVIARATEVLGTGGYL